MKLISRTVWCACYGYVCVCDFLNWVPLEAKFFFFFLTRVYIVLHNTEQEDFSLKGFWFFP